ncbi:glutamyl-tRNA synthetase [Corchorus olitorius]|uniref:Glutamyl-tRNA synthetase n=1 Tax=Corchorus olitorius TaxID=93759 RepID=A0A1R3HBF5_9ROSI|nr:glutamyl-tRNA synthetase [Corchorus olitorius]
MTHPDLVWGYGWKIRKYPRLSRRFVQVCDRVRTNSRKLIRSECRGLVIRRCLELSSVGRLEVDVLTAAPRLRVSLIFSFARCLSPRRGVVQCCFERQRHRSVYDLGA